MISPAQYARARGVSRTAVSKAIKTGRISVSRNARGKMLIDPVQADVEWSKNTDPHRQETGSPKDFAITEQRARRAAAKMPGSTQSAPLPLNSSQSLLEARTRALRARVSLQELELATMRGEMVSRTTLEALLAPKLIAAAEYMQSIPDRVAAIIAVEPRADVIRRLLMDEFQKVLSLLSVDWDLLVLRSN